MPDTITKHDLDEYRRKHFRVIVESSDRPNEPGEIKLSVTTNGAQWQTICLTPIERLKVIRALLEDEERHQ